MEKVGNSKKCQLLDGKFSVNLNNNSSSGKFIINSINPPQTKHFKIAVQDIRDEKQHGALALEMITDGYSDFYNEPGSELNAIFREVADEKNACKPIKDQTSCTRLIHVENSNTNSRLKCTTISQEICNFIYNSTSSYEVTSKSTSEQINEVVSKGMQKAYGKTEFGKHSPDINLNIEIAKKRYDEINSFANMKRSGPRFNSEIVFNYRYGIDVVTGQLDNYRKDILKIVIPDPDEDSINILLRCEKYFPKESSPILNVPDATI